MTIWLDAQLPPQLAEWIKMEFAVEAVAIRDLGLRDASDKMIIHCRARRECDSDE